MGVSHPFGDIFPAEGKPPVSLARQELKLDGSGGGEVGSRALYSVVSQWPALPPPPLLLPLIKSHTDTNGLFLPPPLGGKAEAGEERRGQSGVDWLAF